MPRKLLTISQGMHFYGLHTPYNYRKFNTVSLQFEVAYVVNTIAKVSRLSRCPDFPGQFTLFGTTARCVDYAGVHIFKCPD